MDCQNSLLLVTVLCCLTAFVSRTSSLGFWGGPLLEVLSFRWLSSSRNAVRFSCRYCRLTRSYSYCSSLVFSSLLAPPPLPVAVSLSLTVHCSRFGYLSTFCYQHPLREASSLGVSALLPTGRLSYLALSSVQWLLFLHGTVYLFSLSGPSWFVSSGLSLVSL